MNRALSMTLGLGVALSAGCAPCADFDEMVINDPDDLLSDSDRNNIQYAIDTFAAWTGRSGVCVPAVDISHTLNNHKDDYQGRYMGPWRNIQVAKEFVVYRESMEEDWSYSVDLMSTTRHELCHAFDFVEQVTRTYGVNFRVSDDIQNSSLYPTTRSKRREAFAQRCEGGPKLSLWEEVYSECELDYETRHKQTSLDSILESVVYNETERLEPEPGGWPIRVGPPEWIRGAMWINEQPRLIGMEEGILALGLVQTPQSVGQTVGLLLIDPHSASVIRRIPMPIANGEQLIPRLRLALFQTDGRPRLIADDDGVLRSWAVDVNAGTTHELPTHPSLIDDISSTTVISQGTIFTTNTVDGFPTLRAYDARSGENLDLGLSDVDAWGYTIYVNRLWPTDAGLTMFSLHEGLSEYDIASKSWQHTPIPYWWGLEDAVQLGDNYYLFKHAIHAEEEEYTGLVVYDHTSAQWWLPERPCAATIADYDHSTRFLRAAGSVWLIDNSYTESGQLPTEDSDWLSSRINYRARIPLRLRQIEIAPPDLD